MKLDETMNTTLSTTLSRQEQAARLLQEAGAHLRAARALLDEDVSGYPDLLAYSLQTIQRSLRAFLTWHDLPHTEDTPLREMVEHAVELASSLVTPTDLAVNLEEVEQALQGKPRLSVTEREDIRTGFYTARNTFLTILGELPKSLWTELDLPLGPSLIPAFAQRSERRHRTQRSGPTSTTSTYDP